MGAIYLHCFLILLSVFHTDGRKVFCEAPETYEGKEATISCHFDADISAVQEDVTVYVYKDTESNPVVRYAWVKGRPVIIMEPGYKCNDSISNTLVVSITQVKIEHSGQYKCLVAPSEKADSTACTLRVLDAHALFLKNTYKIAMLVLCTLLGILIILFMAILIISYKKGWISKICKKKECAQLSRTLEKTNAFSNVVLDGMSSMKGYEKINVEIA